MTETQRNRIINLVEQQQRETDAVILATPSGNKRNLYTEANIRFLIALDNLNDAMAKLAEAEKAY